jgi:hypothetical protein
MIYHSEFHFYTPGKDKKYGLRERVKIHMNYLLDNKAR